ncbi:MAG: META domain-containing protein [Anaerolineales bacterium]
MHKLKLLLILGCAILLSACVSSAGLDVELEGTRWELQKMEGQGDLADTFISLKFEGGKVTGTAGCNMYSADYTVQPKGGKSIDVPERTEEDCQEPEGVMEQEERYFQVFGEVAGYRVEGDNLTLMDQRGKALLEYGRIPEYDVEPGDLLGKNWVLTSATGFEGAELGVFTIRFLGDEFRGATICRDYAGAYQAEGDEIRVAYLEMITESGCDEKALKIEG